MGRSRARFITGQKGLGKDGFDRGAHKHDDLPVSDRVTTIVDLDGLWLVRCNCGWHEKVDTKEDALEMKANHQHTKR